MIVGWVAGQAVVSRHGQARPRHGQLLGHYMVAGEPGQGAGRAAGAQKVKRVGVWGELARGRRAR